MKTPMEKTNHKITRRSAINGSIAVAAGALISSGVPLMANDKLSGGSPGGDESVAYVLPEEHWANLVGEGFRIVGYSYDDQEGKARSARLVLSETAEYVPGKVDEDRPLHLRQFGITLLFRGPGNFDLADASYRLQHPWFGEFDVLLSRTKSKKYSRFNVYEAIINS